MSNPIVTWEGGPTTYSADYEGLRLYVDRAQDGWGVVVERASDGAIVAIEAEIDDLGDAKGRAILLPWELGEVE